MKITLEYYDAKITYEEDGNDFSAEELKEIFSRMLVVATFSPDVIEPKDGGKYECQYVEGKDEN